MDFAALAAERVLFSAIADGLFTIIHIARPARGQGDSGSALSLKDSQGTHPEREKQDHAPLPLHVAQNKSAASIKPTASVPIPITSRLRLSFGPMLIRHTVG
jgi:hypothetical protein